VADEQGGQGRLATAALADERNLHEIPQFKK
jgi:hypothetical protein